jgi:hypothetical protein
MGRVLLWDLAVEKWVGGVREVVLVEFGVVRRVVLCF